MDMKNRKKTWKVFGLSLGLALVLLSTNANAQYEGNRGIFGKGENVDASPSRGIMDRGLMGGGITNQTYGSNADGFGITNQTYGQDAPLGSGLLIMAVAGACYAGMKRNKKQTKK